MFIEESAILKDSKKMDIKGSILISILILSLMYGLTNLKFYEFVSSIKSLTVWPFFLIFLILIPLFIKVEKKAEDPVLNLKYFTDKNIALTLIISFIVGSGLMGIVFLPQFGENVLKMKTGSGGYLVTLMAIFSGVAAPFGGKLIDRYSAKLILTLGFSSTIIGTLVLALYTAVHPNLPGLIIGLIFMGFGMGFTMGTPLNYLMQSYVEKSETASAQSTLSLIRSIGVAISPNILIGFIAEAGKQMPEKIMGVLPKLTLPSAPGVAGKTIDIASQGSMSNIPQDLLVKLQAADVTNIVDAVKDFSSKMVDNLLPTIKENMMKSMWEAKMPGMAQGSQNMNFDSIISSWKGEYINSIESSRGTIEAVFQSTLNSGFAKLFIGAAIIALCGLIFTLLLKPKKRA